MRLRIVLPAFALTAILFALPYTALAETVRIPFFGPIVPTAINMCPASFAMFIDVINRIILFSLTIGIVFVAPIMIAYAGFLMVVNPFNSGGIQKAKDIMLHTIVGIVIALAGWLIVAALMAVLYSPTNGLKAWNTIITSGGLDACLKQEGALLQLNQGQVTGSSATGDLTVVTPTPGRFTFDPGISAQMSAASAPLAALLSCMVTKVPAGVGRISSISDSLITSGQKTFAQCAAGGCQHTANSCHYGGRSSCLGSSYAVDFGDEQNGSILTSAARACGASVLNHGPSLHISIGTQNNCGCDTGLR